MAAHDNQRSPLSALQAYLASLPTSTALATTLNTLIRVLLQYTALKTGCSHLLLGTSLTSLAVSLITSVSEGGGFHIKEEVQEEWRPGVRQVSSAKVGSVRVIRPLRDVSTKECAVWAWWARLQIIGKEQWNWPGTKPGVARLTKGVFSRSTWTLVKPIPLRRLHSGTGKGLSIHRVNYCTYVW